MFSFSRQNLLRAFIFVLFVALSVGVAYAAPLFSPGQTLDPGCSPINPDCAVTTSTPATLQSATDAGNVTTRGIQFAGGTSTNSLVVNGFVSSTQLAVGNNTGFKSSGNPIYNDILFKSVITDFSQVAPNSSDMYFNRTEVDWNPSVNIGGTTGTGVFAGDYESGIPSNSTHTFREVRALIAATTNHGSGHIDSLDGGWFLSENQGVAHIDTQYGFGGAAFNEGGTVTTSVAMYAEGGTTSGTTKDDISLLVFTPFTGGTITNHWGLYLQDQRVGTNAYSIYSAGGNVDIENGNLAVNGGSVSGTSIISNGTTMKPNLSATTISFGNAALTTGTCTSTPTTVTGATTGMAIVTTPVTYPGDGVVWMSYVSSANVVTTKVCVIPSITPTVSVYNIRVIQ